MGAWVGGNFSYPMMISTARSRDSAAAGGSARAQRIPQPRALHEKKKKTPVAKAKLATRAARAAWRHAAARGSARAHRIAQPRALHAKRKQKRLWRKLYLQRARREQHGGMRRRGAQLALTVLRSRARCMRNEKKRLRRVPCFAARVFSRTRGRAASARGARSRAHSRAEHAPPRGRLADFVRASGHHASLTAKCSSAPRALADHRLARILPPARRGVSASSRLQLVTGEEALLPRKRNADSAKKIIPDEKKQLEFSRVVIRGRFSTQI